MEIRLTWIAADVMEPHVATAQPSWTLAELERVLCEKKVTGMPVVDGGALVGVVSRSDIVRQLVVERARAGEISDYFRSDAGDFDEALSSIVEEEQFVANRLVSLRVQDVMSAPTFVVSPDLMLPDVAKLLCEHRIHRVPVVEEGRLVGIISSLDIVGMVAGGTLSLPPRAEH
jgi:CBS domain-containing protein